VRNRKPLYASGPNGRRHARGRQELLGTIEAMREGQAIENDDSGNGAEENDEVGQD
jgi:hypothetical protein